MSGTSPKPGVLAIDVRRASPYEFAQTVEPSCEVVTVTEVYTFTTQQVVEASIVLPAPAAWVDAPVED